MQGISQFDYEWLSRCQMEHDLWRQLKTLSGVHSPEITPVRPLTVTKHRKPLAQETGRGSDRGGSGQKLELNLQRRSQVCVSRWGKRGASGAVCDPGHPLMTKAGRSRAGSVCRHVSSSPLPPALAGSGRPCRRGWNQEDDLGRFQMKRVSGGERGGTLPDGTCWRDGTEEGRV